MIENTIYDALAGHDQVLKFIAGEDKRQQENVELIASENFPSGAVKAAAACSFVSKYCEGYPEERETGNKGRYYGGCEFADKLESYCCAKWQEAFNTDYHVNVQPHSGSQANYAALSAVLKPGDTMLAMDLNHGGHLTHGSSVNFSGKLYHVEFYGVDDNGYIDIQDIYDKIVACQPKLVLVGASAYPRRIPFAEIKAQIERAANFVRTYVYTQYETPYFMVDMAHIAGLIVAREHPTPFGYADIITTTTHKTLRGTRGGLIFCKPELAKKVDSAVFPGSQGGPLMHIIAAKAVTADEACTKEFREYIGNVVRNCDAMADEFKKLGFDLVTGGTDNHLLLLDFSKTHPHVTGAMAQEELDRHKITLNKNCVPNDARSPKQTSGVRIGTAAMTTKGYGEEDFRKVARTITEVVNRLEEENP